MLLHVYNLSKMCASLQFHSTLVTCKGSVLFKTSRDPSFEDGNRKVISTPFAIGSHVTSIRRVLPRSQVQLDVILHCFFAGERMHLVIGLSFQFTALPFSIAMAPLEFVCVAPHSSVVRPLVIYCRLHHIFACRNRSN